MTANCFKGFRAKAENPGWMPDHFLEDRKKPQVTGSVPGPYP